MPYKSAILGCGPRGIIHGQAYEGLEEIRLAAFCDMNPERLRECVRRFGDVALYENLEKMLAAEKPDILHIVTPPGIREEPIQVAAESGVRGVIVEKPIALHYAQVQHIKNTVARTGLKIAVNTQRRYFPSCRSLKKILLEQTLGDIHFIRAVTRGNILSMGPHTVDLILYFLGDVSPRHVWATAYGMNGYDYGHPAPANMLVRCVFPGDVTVYLEDAEDAVGTIGDVGEPEFWQHLELDIWGGRGYAWWKQNISWGYQISGMTRPFEEQVRWDESDIPGQREFTRAMARWLDDDKDVHLNCLDNALRGFDIIMGTLQSVYTGRPVTLPPAVDDNLMSTLEGRIQ